MPRLQLTELNAFVAVAEHSSFTRAAAQMGVALPTMSQTIRTLEDRLGVRLFNRTTRSVALTEAGGRLLQDLQPVLEGIDHALESVNSFRDKPKGLLRVAVARGAAAILMAPRVRPLVAPFLAEYPDIQLEVAYDDTHSDIVSERFDAGIRIGHRVERDMTILRLADEFRMVTVATPDYLARRGTPLTLDDLHRHDCIRYRLDWDGSLASWVFMRNRHPVEIAVAGRLIVNDANLMVTAALEGVGLGHLPEPVVREYIAEGRLTGVLEDWSHTLPGIFLYHPSRRQTPMPLQVFLRFVEQWRRGAFDAL